MTDRLKEIRQHIANITPSLPVLVGHIDWLITEVERYRLNAIRAQEHMEEYARDVVRLEDEIKRLQRESDD